MINAFFDGSCRSVSSQPAYLHDYGQTLRVVGLNLPAVVEAHFALEESGESTLRAGSCSDGITTIPIPDSFLEEVGSFFCYIFYRGDTSGRTVYKIKIPVLKRADMPTETTEPSGQDVSYFEQVLAQIEEKAEEINSAVISTAPFVVVFDTVGSGDSAVCTCRQTFADVINALSSGRSVMAVEYRYSQSTDDDPYQTRYHCLMGVGTSQIKFGENGLTFMSSRDPAYGDAWMITAPYIILKSNGTVVRTSATGSPAMMGDINALTSSMTESYKVTFYRTRTSGDNYTVTCDKTLAEITEAFSVGKYVYAEGQISYDGETFAVQDACLPCIDSGNQNFIFGWNGMYLLHEDNPDQSDSWETHYSCYELRYNYQTQQEEAVWTYGTTCHATLTDLNALTDRISALEARVAALEGGN